VQLIQLYDASMAELAGSGFEVTLLLPRTIALRWITGLRRCGQLV